ncbi:phosphomannose isomerase [Sulfolobales archaeon HS-7]|nr:phosphomannose isomerase [Sulfolobales archaeon HS-7]
MYLWCLKVLDVYSRWDELFYKALDLEVPIIPVRDKVFIAGLGGSGITGDVVELLDPPFSFQTLRTVSLPRAVDRLSNLIAVTYSGNTVETLRIVLSSLERGAHVIGITSGGKMWKICEEKDLDCIKVPGGEQPRVMFPYLVIPLLNVINFSYRLGLRITDMADGIRDSKDIISAGPKELSEKILGKVPVIYSSKYFPVAERMKQEINENAKYPAFFNRIPEIHHNEIEGFRHFESLFPIILGHDEISEVTNKLINSYIVRERFSGRLKNAGFLVYFGDLTSIHLANELKEDPYALHVIPKARQMTEELS